MKLIRTISLCLLAAAVVAGGFELVGYLYSGEYRPYPIAQAWYAIDANSLVGFQAAVENKIGPGFWPPIQTVLSAPLWAAFLVLALFGLIISRNAGNNRSQRIFTSKK